MADIIKTVGAGHGAPDYATLALWNTGEGGVDPGVGFTSIADCSGDCGSGATINGAFIRSYVIQGDVTSDGTNDTSLSSATQLTVQIVGTINDLKIKSSTSFRSLQNNSISTYNRCFIENTSTGVAIQELTTTAGCSYNNCTIDGAITTSFNDGADFNNCTQFGSGGLGFDGQGAFSLTACLNVFAFNNTGDDYDAAPFVTTSFCASEDLTGDQTGFTSAELVNFGARDFRTKSTSTLATSGSGGTFIGAFLEASSGISITTGTAIPTQTEADIVTGGKTIILTLTGDTWVTAGATFNAQRQAIIDGLDSAQSELTGWNNEVRDNEVVTAVVRTSSTVVTITLTASASYDITSTETITATIPAAALVTSVSAIISSPTFTVTPIVSGISIPVIMNQLRNQGIS